MINSKSSSEFAVNSKIVGKMVKGSEFPQSPDHPDPIGTLDTDIFFEGVVLENADKVVFRITEINDHNNYQFENVRERGTQAITIGQIFSIDELTGWEVKSA